MDFEKNIGKIKVFYSSIKNHLEPEYRKQYLVRKIVSCLLLYAFLTIMFEALWMERTTITKTVSLFLTILWTASAFIFWHYSFWKFKGGAIDSISNNIMYFGTIFSLIGKILLHYGLLLIWIAFIAPFSGFFAWGNAVKKNIALYV